jgi:hypothetical protein
MGVPPLSMRSSEEKVSHPLVSRGCRQQFVFLETARKYTD